MRKSLLSYSGILVLGVLLILVNGISMGLLGRFSFDLTKEHLYTLSPGTKNIIASIHDPITLKLYYSKTEGAKYPAIGMYGNRILEILREYARIGGGKIVVENYDPRPDSEEEEWAQKFGVTPIPTREGDQLFLGLAGVNSLGNEEVIPAFNFSRQEYLEYDISKMLASLANPKKPVVAVLSSLSVNGDESVTPTFGRQRGQNEAWYFVSQLSDAADVRFLKPDLTEVDAEADVLAVIHPKNLGETALYAIDQFVMRGGKLIVLEDPFCEADQPKNDPQNPMGAIMADRSSSLNALLSKWGVELIEKRVVGDLELSTKVDGGKGEVLNFLLWLSLRRPNMNANDMVTASLENVVLPWAGALKIAAPEGVTVEPLLTSTGKSELVAEDKYRFNGGDPEELLKNFTPSNQEQVLAARIRGKLKSAFPSGRPGAAAAANASGAAASPAHLAESKEVANVIVIADVDFLADRYSVQAQNFFGAKIVSLMNDNQALFQNAVENMLGSNDLISIRSRGQFSRPFTVVQHMEVDAQQRFQMEESVLQAKLNAANQRLSQLQAGGAKPGEKPVFSKAVMEEIKQFREERREAQTRLREVRRGLRQNIEQLGDFLFLANTFFVPLLLIAGSLVYHSRRKRKA